jgi:hypothetical protein
MNWPSSLRSVPSPESTTPELHAGRFVTIMATAIAMSSSVAHLMELPSKMQYEPSLYVRLHRTLYPNFGRIAGSAEAVAVITTAALAGWTRRKRPHAFPFTAAAAGCLAAAHGIFWTVVNPVNIEMVKWPLDAIPPDWMTARDRWEYGHAVRAGLMTTALAALIASLLAETGDSARPRHGPESRPQRDALTPAS